MAFGQAFATAFLNGLTGQIQERTREAKEERKRRERIAETAGLQQYLKRQANFNKYLNIAKKIQKLGGNSDETKQNIAKLVTNPELLLSANSYIDSFTQKFPNVKITPARINGFISNLDLVMPEEGLSFKEAAKKAAGLVVQNTNLEEEKKDPNAMENNIFMSLLGVGAEKRELEKLKSKKVGQGFSTYDLYTMAMGGDYTPIDQATGALDFSYFPKPFTISKENLVGDVVEAATLAGLDSEIAALQEGKAKKSRTGKSLAELEVQRSNYAAGIGRDGLDAIYASKKIADDILTTGNLSGYMQAQKIGKRAKREALKILIDNPIAVNTFGEEELKRQASLLNMSLKKTGQVDSEDDKMDDNLSNTLSNEAPKVGADEADSDGKVEDPLFDKVYSTLLKNPFQESGKKYLPREVDGKQVAVDNPNFGKSAIEIFVGMYGTDRLPSTISEFENVSNTEKVRPRFNSYEQSVWDDTWGKYYKPDGTRK